MKDGFLPLRRPTNEHVFKGHDRLRGDVQKDCLKAFCISVFQFFNLIQAGLRVGVVGDDQTELI